MMQDRARHLGGILPHSLLVWVSWGALERLYGWVRRRGTLFCMELCCSEHQGSQNPTSYQVRGSGHLFFNSVECICSLLTPSLHLSLGTASLPPPSPILERPHHTSTCLFPHSVHLESQLLAYIPTKRALF